METTIYIYIGVIIKQRVCVCVCVCVCLCVCADKRQGIRAFDCDTYLCLVMQEAICFRLMAQDLLWIIGLGYLSGGINPYERVLLEGSHIDGACCKNWCARQCASAF